MAACWKVSWNVDPLALSVPDRAALLLDEEPWSRLAPLFDFSIFVDVPRNELERRLRLRWDEHGKSEADAIAWIASNDMPNIERVLARRRKADLVVGDPG